MCLFTLSKLQLSNCACLFRSSGTESEVKKIAWKLPAKEGNCQELVRNLDLISEHLQGEQVIKLARTLFGR